MDALQARLPSLPFLPSFLSLPKRHVELTTSGPPQHWFFWNWKIDPSSKYNAIRAPLWSYQLGLQEGWMPLDPRDSTGACASYGISSPFAGPLKPTQTGGAGAGTIDAAWSTSYGAWPVTSINPVSIGVDATKLPRYTATGSLTALPVPQFTVRGKVVDAGSGWAVGGVGDGKASVPVGGCAYPDPWNAVNDSIPNPACGVSGAAGAAKRRSFAHPLEARMTPAPQV